MYHDHRHRTVSRIRHGPMEPLDEGFYAFLRVDRPLVNHYTSTEGVPLTY